jgi:hypothetical protein
MAYEHYRHTIQERLSYISSLDTVKRLYPHQLDFHCTLLVNTPMLHTKDADIIPCIKSVLTRFTQLTRIPITYSDSTDRIITDISLYIQHHLLCEDKVDELFADRGLKSHDAVLLLTSTILGRDTTVGVAVFDIMVNDSVPLRVHHPRKTMIDLHLLCGASCTGGAGTYLLSLLKVLVYLGSTCKDMVRYGAHHDHNAFTILLTSIEDEKTRTFYQRHMFDYVLESHQDYMNLYPMRWTMTLGEKHFWKKQSRSITDKGVIGMEQEIWDKLAAFYVHPYQTRSKYIYFKKDDIV